jgi:ribosomal protein S18 acetylase RimI-like enzyme
MSELAYRQATPEDAAAIAAVALRLWEEMGEGSGFRQPPSEGGFRPLLAGDRQAVFLCESEGTVWGFALLMPDETEPAAAVMGVWVLPEARRQGIGRELALMATEFARAAGYERLRGLLPAGNEPALSFFSDIGGLVQVVGRGMEYELPL